MKIENLKLIKETETHFIFEITCIDVVWFKEVKTIRLAFREKKYSFSHFMDNGDSIHDNGAINAWLSTDKKDLYLGKKNKDNHWFSEEDSLMLENSNLKLNIISLEKQIENLKK